VGRITGKWKQERQKAGGTPQNKKCEEFLKSYVGVPKEFLEQFNNANPKSTNWDPVISQLQPKLELF
jgi:hypothetical protein